MRCPYCLHETTEVVETRDNEDLSVTRRRRTCQKCARRFTTYERIEIVPLAVLKKNGEREQFDRTKLILGIDKAAEKTSVIHEDANRIADEIERELRGNEKKEIESQQIGQMVAERLRKIDKVAYIRFASVFKRFVDVEEFERELHKLI